METNTLAIQSYRSSNPAPRNEMRAVSNSSSTEVVSAAIINIAEKKDQVNPEVKSGAVKWVMPPVAQAYMKGRDHDPL